ncbi:MAG: polysaccharide biosynthesis protein [Clostridiales bacterium]|nr:polysaccharide biosynthesis protein [Clostridiales bacterium]
MQEKRLLLKNTLVISIGNFIAKIIGAFYRIPLTNFLGGTGIGLYQMVFPVYALLLDFSMAVPTALSKNLVQIEEKKERQKYFYASLKALFFIGLFGMAFLIFFAKPISYLQGDKNAFFPYLFLAPSVFLVSLISCFRGFFQSKINMYPTAISQIVEQGVKLVFGLVLVNVLVASLTFSVSGATLAVTLSELIALTFLVVYYKKKTKERLYIKLEKTEQKKLTKHLFKTAIPIMLIGISLPISHLIDSFLIINVLKSYREDATLLYGLFSGSAHSVINMPVSVCYGVSIALIPLISKVKGKKKENGMSFSILLTLILSVPCFLFILFFADKIVNILFFRLDYTSKTTLIGLLKTMSPIVILLSLTQTTNAILISLDKSYRSLFNMLIAISIKIPITVILLFNQNVNVYAGVIASICAFLVATFLNLLYICIIRFNESREGINGYKVYKAW